MKNDLIWGWIFIGLSILMLACVIYGCCIGNWTAVPMCSFALTLNVCNAIGRFKDYKRRRDWDTSWERFNETFKACWPDEDDDDESGDNNSSISEIISD